MRRRTRARAFARAHRRRRWTWARERMGPRPPTPSACRSTGVGSTILVRNVAFQTSKLNGQNHASAGEAAADAEELDAEAPAFALAGLFSLGQRADAEAEVGPHRRGLAVLRADDEARAAAGRRGQLQAAHDG